MGSSVMAVVLLCLSPFPPPSYDLRVESSRNSTETVGFPNGAGWEEGESPRMNGRRSGDRGH